MTPATILQTRPPICGICHKPILDGNIHLDHIIPKSCGGPERKWNLRPTHPLCNFRRHDNIEPFQLPLEAAKRHFRYPKATVHSPPALRVQRAKEPTMIGNPIKVKVTVKGKRPDFATPTLARQLKAQGKKVSEIAREWGISEARVYVLLKQE